MSTPHLYRYGFLRPSGSVFFLCDLQERFIPTLSYAKEVVQNSARLAKVSKILGIPLIVSEQNPTALGKTVPDIDISHASLVSAKTQFSMLNSEIWDCVKKMPVATRSAVLFGIETHACVEQTAMALKSLGIIPHVVADACTSRSLEDRLLSLQRMATIGCFITTSENIIFKLLGDANHPKFKEISQLVKEVTPSTGLCSLGSFGKDQSET